MDRAGESATVNHLIRGSQATSRIVVVYRASDGTRVHMNSRNTGDHDDLERLSQRLNDIAADVREAMAHARDLQAQLSNLARSVLYAAAELERRKR